MKGANAKGGIAKNLKIELDIDSEWKKCGNFEFAVKIKQYRLFL